MWLLCVGTVRALGAYKSILYFRGIPKKKTHLFPTAGIFAIGNGGGDRGHADADGGGSELDRRYRIEVAEDGE